MAKPKKLPSGSWRVQVVDHYEVRNGKRVPVRVSITVDDPTREGKKKAEKLAATYRDEHAHRSEAVTVEDAIRQYIDAKTGLLSPPTIRAYNSMLKNGIFDQISGRKLSDLSEYEVQMWARDLSRVKSAKYVVNAFGLLRPALRLTGSSRLRNIEITLPHRKKPDTFAPTDDQVVQLLTYCTDHGLLELRSAVCLAAFGSLRRSEICALTPADFNGNAVTINKSVVRDIDTGWTAKPYPKTDSSERVAFIPAACMDLVDLSGPRVVSCNPDALANRMRRAVRFAGLPAAFTLHSLRRYYVSVSHALQISDQYVMAMGGWRTDQIMKEHYRKALPDVEEREQRKLHGHFEEMLKEEKKKKVHTKVHTKAI